MGKKKARQSKGVAQTQHFKKRMWLRYSIDPTDEEIADMIRSIQRGNCVCVEKQSLRVSIHCVKLRDTEIHVVYDKLRKTLVTVLYPDESFEEVGAW